MRPLGSSWAEVRWDAPIGKAGNGGSELEFIAAIRRDEGEVYLSKNNMLIGILGIEPEFLMVGE